MKTNDQLDPFVKMDDFRACKSSSIPSDFVSRLTGELCYGGLVYSGPTELVGFVLWFPKSRKTLEHYWIPLRSAMRSRSSGGPRYDDLVDDGWVKLTDGCAYDPDIIRRDIVKISRIFNIHSIAYEPWAASSLAVTLKADGLKMVECRHGFMSLSPACEFLRELIATRFLRHAGNPLTEWCFENTFLRNGATGDQVAPSIPNRTKTENRITGALAMIMAVRAEITAAEFRDMSSEPVAQTRKAPSANASFIKHEVMDRAYVVQSMFEEHLLNHDGVIADRELAAAAQRVHLAFLEFYQLAGSGRYQTDGAYTEVKS